VCKQRASTIEIVHIENEEAIALESTYLAIMTLIATTIQHVRNKSLQICVTAGNNSTTVEILTSAMLLQISVTSKRSETGSLDFKIRPKVQ
jgi:hypothetical protein